jgi:hypothetical protein
MYVFVFIIALIFGEEYNLWSPLSCNFLHSPYDHAKYMFHFNTPTVNVVARVVIIGPIN